MNHTDNPIISALQTIEGGRTMNFYEITEPYYALIKAEDKAEAEKIFNETVADTDEYENFQEEEINVVSRDYALIEFTKAGDGEEILNPQNLSWKRSTNRKARPLLWTVPYYEHSIQSLGRQADALLG